MTNAVKVAAGSFSHFRLVGEGSNDENLQADLTSAGYSVDFKSTAPVDLYFFDASTDDYSCFVQSVEQWVILEIIWTCPSFL